MDSLIAFGLQIVDLVLHVDQYLQAWTALYGPWIYALLFIIVFCETGLVFTPFLPGDSLLFAAGALTALPEGGLSYWPLALLLIVAAFLGDQTNYFVGRWFGARILQWTGGRWIKVEHLKTTEEFMVKYGASAIVLARFAPIVRTFVPFVAGIGKMDRKRFVTYNIVGALSWVFIFLSLGHFFGNLPAVQKNFSLVIVVIVVLSVLPMAWAWWKARMAKTTVRSLT